MDVYVKINESKFSPVASHVDTSMSLILKIKVKLVGKVAASGLIDLKPTQPAPHFGQGHGPRKPDFTASVAAPNAQMEFGKGKLAASLDFTDDSTVF